MCIKVGQNNAKNRSTLFSTFNMHVTPVSEVPQTVFVIIKPLTVFCGKEHDCIYKKVT